MSKMIVRAIKSSRSLLWMRSRLMSSYHGGEGIPAKYQKFRPAVMDEFPVPQGLWKEAYDKQQTKYNWQLIFATVAYFATVIYVYNTIDFVMPPPMKNEK